MGSSHWRDDELIARLYGLGPEDGHLEECGDCAARYAGILATRERVLRLPDLSREFTDRQRRAIRKAAETPKGRPAWFGSVSATAALMLAAVMVYRPAPKIEPVPLSPEPTVIEAELISEVFALAGSSEPVAAAPIRYLFEGKQ
jgi:anti-sigma factor RsiW